MNICALISLRAGCRSGQKDEIWVCLSPDGLRPTPVSSDHLSVPAYANAAAIRFCSALEMPTLVASVLQEPTAVSTDFRAASA